MERNHRKLSLFCIILFFLALLALHVTIPILLSKESFEESLDSEATTEAYSGTTFSSSDESTTDEKTSPLMRTETPEAVATEKVTTEAVTTELTTTTEIFVDPCSFKART